MSQNETVCGKGRRIVQSGHGLLSAQDDVITNLRTGERDGVVIYIQNRILHDNPLVAPIIPVFGLNGIFIDPLALQLDVRIMKIEINL